MKKKTLNNYVNSVKKTQNYEDFSIDFINMFNLNDQISFLVNMLVNNVMLEMELYTGEGFRISFARKSFFKRT